MRALNNLSTKSRLLIILLLIGLGATIMSAILAWQTSKEALVESASKELQGIRKLKAEQVETYFDTLNTNLLTLSKADRKYPKMSGGTPLIVFILMSFSQNCSPMLIMS